MNNIIRLGLLCILLSGCRDEFTITIPSEPGYQFNVLSELSPNRVVDIRLNENISIGRDLDHIDRQDAMVTFSGDDVPGGSINMAFNATSQKYHLVREDFRVKEGKSYHVSIIVPNENMDTITADANIPVATGFSVEFIGSKVIPIDSVFSHHELEVSISFDQPKQRPAYYRFIPYRLESIVRDNNGGIDVINFGTKTMLKVLEVLEGQSSVSYFNHKEGVTIDESRLNQSKLHLVLRTIKPLKDGAAVNAQDGKERIFRLQFDMFTLSQEIYDYDVLLNLVNQGGNISLPSRSVSNIKGATGVFGGSSNTTVFINLN